MSPHRSDSMETHDNVRKRVCKACDRCRLKKSKCDGASPCSRCKADNAICVFGERKKSQDKVYPKGYVEMLEQQQTQLVAGLRELYSRLQRGEGWPGQALRESTGGHPLTHDILERLELLHPSSQSSEAYERFEDDCHQMQQRLLERGAPYTRRRGSISSDSEHGQRSSSPSHSGTPATRSSFAFINPFARHHAPPTPPMNSPFPRQSQMASPVKQEPSMAGPAFLEAGCALDPASLARATWGNDGMAMDEPLDFSKPLYGFDGFAPPFDPPMMAIDPAAMMDPMMPDWTGPSDVDLNHFLQHSVGA